MTADHDNNGMQDDGSDPIKVYERPRFSPAKVQATIIVVIGLLLLFALGFAVYTYAF